MNIVNIKFLNNMLNNMENDDIYVKKVDCEMCSM